MAELNRRRIMQFLSIRYVCIDVQKRCTGCVPTARSFPCRRIPIEDLRGWLIQRGSHPAGYIFVCGAGIRAERAVHMVKALLPGVDAQNGHA